MGSGFYDELVKILKKNGCYKLREAKGSHEWWCSPINNHRFPVSKTINKRELSAIFLSKQVLNNLLFNRVFIVF